MTRRWSQAASRLWTAVTVASLTLAPARSAAPQSGGDRGTRALGASLSGFVFDSMSMRPLSNAVVQLAPVAAPGQLGRVRSARSDSGGRFAFDTVSPGTYLLGFQHVAMDSLGLQGSVKRVDVRTASAVRVPLTVPSLTTLVRTVCGQGAPKDSLAVLVGSVRDARNDTPLPRSYVSLRWAEVFISRAGSLSRETPIVDVYSNEEGWFAACVPGDTPLLTRASHELDVSGDVELAVPVYSVLRRDIYVGYAEASVVGTSGDPVRRSGAAGDGERIVNRGRGSVRGLVRGADGRPVPGVRLALLSGASEVRTDDRGTFTLAGVPHGTHTLEARAIGYLPAQEIIDIVAFRESSADFTLIDLRATELDTMRISAARHLEAAARAGFDRRRKGGSGYFLDEAQLDSMRPFSFKDLVRGIPGIRFVRGNTLETQWREHIEFSFGGRSAPCVPTIYLDGTLLVSGRTDLDVIINANIVKRLEVYHRGVSIPAEFASSATCGVLAIWTGTRRGAPPGDGR